MNANDILLLGLRCSVTAFSKTDGRVLWKTELAGNLSNTFVTVLADGQRVFAHSGGSLYCLDLGSGKILWSDGLSGYGYGLGSLCFPNSPMAPAPAEVERIMAQRRSSAS